MNQIAIGGYAAAGEWLVVHGEGIAAPFKQADYHPSMKPVRLWLRRFC